MQNRYPCSRPDIFQIIERLFYIRQDILRKEKDTDEIQQVHPAHLKSARNLVHYLALRSHDIRIPQLLLTELGLSSLGRAERKVQATIDSVLVALHQISGQDWSAKEKPPVCFREGRELLESNTEAVVGPNPSGRRVRIMVTMPTEAAYHYDLVKDLILNGMNCARINSVHDGPDIWKQMIANIRKAEDATGQSCQIHMDLGGPKLRTGRIEDGPRVRKVRPLRNDLGKVKKEARIYFYKQGLPLRKRKGIAASIPVKGNLLSKCRKGQQLALKDARKSMRYLTIEKVVEGGVIANTNKTIYFVPGLPLEKVGKGKGKNGCKARIGNIQPKDNFLLLRKGNIMELKRDIKQGRPGFRDKRGQWHPPCIGCSHPQIFEQVKVDEPIWFDDGKLGGTVEEAEDGLLRVRIDYARPKGVRLRGEKGINVPESDLVLPSLTEQDMHNLPFAVAYADTIGLSFANSAEDVQAFIDALEPICRESLHGRPSSDLDLPGILVKVETKRGFDNLPQMILTAMQMPRVGVMIARGDLAIECGFGRLAEVQEEILWVCESAHVPVVWATQVLEGLAKDGMATRSEITDAAMGQRAECIMLNKGEHIVLATRALDDILRRMQDHMTKKRALFRKLHLAEKFFRRPVPV